MLSLLSPWLPLAPLCSAAILDSINSLTIPYQFNNFIVAINDNEKPYPSLCVRCGHCDRYHDGQIDRNDRWNPEAST